MSKRLFGTDGVRGLAGEEPLTANLALALGRAVASRVRSAGQRPMVVVGRDTRLSGDMLEAAFCAGLCAGGADARPVGVLPTPAVAFLTRSLGAAAGAMISASHNPFPDNGIKLFSGDGFKLSDKIELEIERDILQGTGPTGAITGEHIGRIRPLQDAAAQYTVHLRQTVEADVRLDGMKILVDAGHGAGAALAAPLFEALGARVILQGHEPDGTNINSGVGALHPESLQQAVRRSEAQLGVALDGDADRAILVDELGVIQDGDACLAVLGESLLSEGRLPSRTVVATQMSNLGLEQFFSRRGITLLRTQVGDRYVVEAMRAGGHPLGGEQSGHVIFLDHATTGDGLLTALQVARILVRRGLPLSELARELAHYPQVLVNVRLKRREPLESLPAVVSAIEHVRNILGADGRVLVRFSGTEPLARVMIEGRDNAEIKALAQEIADEIARALA